MADFDIVVAALAGIASGGPAVPAIPIPAPTVGFRTYATVEACEDAALHLKARHGTRLVCLPVETQAGELASAY
ncbi:hypothetical protein E2C06_19450 [Dankookia rubra]|uniref:Uncharacterized protein n=1 Tax=Dankookia rubra TaxID=1442381 RepID=A0A4R5QCR0_9PROT|nr:hypothetical protein [Dankookia rubra]TDH60914.1 hypothetical protein E2C06_19450 [Dankookia rubra]